MGDEGVALPGGCRCQGAGGRCQAGIGVPRRAGGWAEPQGGQLLLLRGGWIESRAGGVQGHFGVLWHSVGQGIGSCKGLGGGCAPLQGGHCPGGSSHSHPERLGGHFRGVDTVPGCCRAPVGRGPTAQGMAGTVRGMVDLDHRRGGEKWDGGAAFAPSLGSGEGLSPALDPSPAPAAAAISGSGLFFSR